MVHNQGGGRGWIVGVFESNQSPERQSKERQLVCRHKPKGVSNCTFTPLYFPPLTSPKVLMSNSNLQQFYNGGGRGGKIGQRFSFEAV